ARQQGGEGGGVAAPEGLAHFQHGAVTGVLCPARGRQAEQHGHNGCEPPPGDISVSNATQCHRTIMDNIDGQSSLHSLKTEWRKALIDKRQNLADRAWRNDMLQRVMRVWLIDRPEAVIGAYWPIKGEFDPLPALFRWQEAGLEED